MRRAGPIEIPVLHIVPALSKAEFLEHKAREQTTENHKKTKVHREYRTGGIEALLHLEDILDDGQLENSSDSLLYR